MNREFKGVWIPKEIWVSKELTWMEKLFLTEIESLNNEKGCYASNSYFAEFFDLTASRCSQIISSLNKKEFITVGLTYKEGTKQVDKRIIKTGIKNIKGGYVGGSKNTKGGSKNTKHPPLEYCEDNNTFINNTYNNKESEGTRSNDLNSIQEKAGNKSYDVRPLRDDEVKNKFTDLSDKGKKLLWNELINIVWNYANKSNWINDINPKRWEILQLAIKEFYGHHLDKGNFESEFFNFERKLIQWIDKDVLRESSIPYSVWNKTEKDIKGDPKQSEDHPQYYDTQYKRKCNTDQWKIYRNWLLKNKYYVKRSNAGEIWMTPEHTNAEFKDVRRKA